MQEKYVFYALILSTVLGLIGFFWLVVRAFKVHWLWGVGLLVFPPLALVFIALHFRKALGPLLICLASLLITGSTYRVSYYYSQYVNPKAREKVVEAEVHITLTGLKDYDYSVLKTKPDTVVLQMANEDVTDQTLENLKGMAKLRELDLNYTQVTDEGLRTLKDLPQLKILRLRKTKVTDQGFRDHLGDKETLLEIDLRDTAVTRKTLGEWKEKKMDERKYQR